MRYVNTMRIIIGLAMASCTLPALATTYTLQDIMSSKAVPYTITYKELTPEWRQFELQPSRTGGENFLLTLFVSDMAHGGNGLTPKLAYYTRGDTVTNGDRHYLIAYRKTVLNQQDIRSLMNSDGDVEEIIRKKLADSPDMQLNLCLLDLSETTALLNLQAFEQKVQESTPVPPSRAHARALQEQSMNNLKQLAVGAMMYCQDNNELMPKITGSTNIVKLLNLPEKCVLQPYSNEAYRYNMAVSGKALGIIQDPVQTPMFYEPTSWPDGSRIVAYVDGHVEQLSRGRWTQLQHKWKLP
ncbi:MAG TPA: hypothetical protein VHV83_21040 [Armatimonadota bacterium]|nr:hypothetical protein [Armatimonadota bacterium]